MADLFENMKFIEEYKGIQVYFHNAMYHVMIPRFGSKVYALYLSLEEVKKDIDHVREWENRSNFKLGL